MKENQGFQWTPEVEADFQSLTEALCTAPILPYPQPRESFVHDKDTSNIGIGGVLPQVQDGQERVTAYYTKTKQGRGNLLCHLSGTTCHREDPGTFP
jgi:hypothetical protein